MYVTEERRIALISIIGDPAVNIAQAEAGSRDIYVRQIGEALARQGWRVDLFTRRTSVDQPAVVNHGLNCRTIRLVAGPETFVDQDQLFAYLPEFVHQFRAFQQREGLEYPLIHTNHWLSSWVGMELKKHQPLIQVHTYHSLGALKYQVLTDLPAIATTRLAVEKACWETADRIVATSPQEQEKMQSLLSPQGCIEMVPCGTDLNRFGAVQRQQARLELGIAPEAKVVLYVGRFSRRKGIETLVRAMAYSSLRGKADLKLVIAGGSSPSQRDGLEQDSLERDRIAGIVAELGLSDLTTFPGYLDETNLPLYYAAGDVCAIPSHYEPFGPVAIEVMASGTPVIASNVGGLRFTVVPEVTGLLVPPQDQVALAQGIDRVLTNPEWRDQLGQTGRQRAEIAFSWDSVAARLAHLYTQLLLQPALLTHQTQLVA